MNLEDFILADELCSRYQVERRFIHALHDSEIIHITTVKQQEYLPVDCIADFEKMRRLYYEMNINLEGLEAIQTLLDNIQQLQSEKKRLENRLRLYE